MTMTITELTPLILAEQARERGTPILELAACDKCRDERAIYFYQREGRTHNGCLWCRHLDGKDPLMANANQEVLTSAQMVDDNDNPIYEGRACKVCGGKTRLVGTAYGSKNKGACLACSIHQQAEREQGRELKRVNRAVSQKVHKFIVQSIERSETVKVAPRTQQEFFELRELAYRCQLENERERTLGTGIRWELGHKFPARVEGELRGKATADNVYLVQYAVNRAAGNDVPEQWEQRQVISLGDCRRIQNSQEAARAWKDAKTWEQALTPAEKKERTMKERQANAEHQERVKAIVGNAFPRVVDFFQHDYLPTFAELKRDVEAKWDRITLKMSRVIDAAIQSGRDVPYAEIRERKLTAEAFCGAASRMWIVVQTFQQLQDAAEILREQGLTDEQEQQLVRVLRYAVMWAWELLNNPQVLVMGFTHPVLSVLGDVLIWGSREDEHGKQWICVWQQPTADELTPFDEPIERRDPSTVNPALTHNQEVLTSEPAYNYADGWKSTAADYVYEQRKHKAAREAKERRQREQEAAAAAQRAAAEATLSNRIATEKRAAMEGLEPLWWYAEAEWSGTLLNDAQRIIADVMAEAHQQQDQIERCQTVDELNSWLVSNNYRQRMMRNPDVVFADIINPF